MPRTVSVVMPVKNEARRIARALAAIRAQTLQPLEIIVVDGRSTDRTVEIAESCGARVLFEDYQTRAGACDIGLREAAGELVAFTDADCVADPTWLENLEARFRPDLAGVGGRIINEGETFWEQSIDAALDTLVGSANSVQGRLFPEEHYVSSISGCNAMYRRADVLAVGGFKTDLETTEDTELNRRMLKRGRLLYTPEAVIHHHHDRSLKDFAARMFQYGYGRGQSLLPGPPVIMPVAVAALVLLALVRPEAAVFVIAAYFAVLLASAAVAATKHRRPPIFLSVTLVYLVEHGCYAAGFWWALIRRRATRRGKATSLEGDTS